MKTTFAECPPPPGLYPFPKVKSECASLLNSTDRTDWHPFLRSMVGVILESRVGMCIAWGEESTLFYNDAFAAVLGSAHPVAMGAKAEDVLPASWASVRRCFHQFSIQESPEVCEGYLAFTLGGSSAGELIRYACSPLRSDSGEVGGSLLTITERLPNTTTTLLAQAPLAIVAFEGPDHIFTLVNEIAQHMLYDENCHLIGKKVSEAIPEVKEQGFTQLLDQVYRTGEPYSGKEIPLHIIQRDGFKKEFYVNFIYQALRDHRGRITGVSSMAYDVTELVEARKKIEVSESRFRSLSDVLPQLMWTSAPDGSVNYANQRCLDYSGLDSQEKYGDGWVSSIHEADLPLVGRLWGESIVEGKPFEAEYRIKRHDGVYRWFLGRAIPIKNPSGEVEQWIGTATEIEDQKEAQQKLEVETKLREQFVATLTHDLRNPLTSARLNAQTLMKFNNSAAHAAAASGRIITALDRLNQMIDNLLDASKIKSGEPLRLELEPVTLNELIQETVDELSSTLSQSFFVEAPSSQVTGLWSKEALRRILENLCSNAHKYGDQTRPVTVTLRTSSSTTSIGVQNWGVPIPAHELADLFLPFRQSGQSSSMKKGWGLGLTLVKGFTEAMEGNISVESTPEHGTVFTVNLPLKAL